MQTSNVNVPIKVTGRHVSVTEPIKDYAMKKIEALHLDYPRIIDAQVILDVEKHRHFAEIILHCNNHITIEASEETDDIRGHRRRDFKNRAANAEIYKTKILRNHRPRRHEVQHFDEQVFHLDEAFAETEGHVPEVIKTERYPVKPMFVDEAVLQIEMSNRQFVVFLNAKTEKINVLHRRKDGGFGLMEPIFA